MIWITRDSETMQMDMTEEEFLASSLPSKGWVITTAPEPYIPSIAELQTATEAMIRDKTENLMLSIVAPYRQSERDTWFVQVPEARDVANNVQGATAPLLTALVANTGETIQEVSNTILQLDTGYKMACGTLLNQQRVALKALFAEGVTREQVEVIQNEWMLK